MTLNSLGIKYNTDKASEWSGETPAHNYLNFYEATLPKQPRRILEIGYGKGASVRMWREYFPPTTEVHILDLFELEAQPANTTDTFFHKGDATHPYILSSMRNLNADVIIDDGSHNSRDQMITFFGLMHAGCHYYIEDLHCCDEEFYRDGLPRHLTATEYFKINSPFYVNRMIESKNIILIAI